MLDRTKQRIESRVIAAEELVKIRRKLDVSGKTAGGNRYKSNPYISDLCVKLFGSYNSTNRAALYNLENGSRSINIDTFYEYLKVLGMKDKDIASNFLRVCKMMIKSKK